MSYVVLSPVDLALAALLLLVNAGVSIAFRLGLERTLLMSLVRMVAQLLIAGIVLKFVFEQGEPWLTALAALVMVLAAGWEARARQHRKLSGWSAYLLGSGTLLVAGTAVTAFAMLAVIKPDPWYGPRYVLPILGMILGNALTGVALVLDAVTERAYRERGAIEARLALGATRFEALHATLAGALRTGLIPLINSMAATGLVTLPGMMTGQILAGADPIEAAKYQVIIMCLIGGATALAAVLTGLWSVALLTDERHRLRLDRLKAENA
jgi:putative ABC transport system permease protein